MRVRRRERFAYGLDRVPIESDVTQQWKVRLRTVVGVYDLELGSSGVEAKLDPLDQKRVLHRASLVVEDQDPVREKELILLRFALESNVKFEEFGKNREGLDRGALLQHPGVLGIEKIRQRRDAVLGTLEGLDTLGRLPGLLDEGLGVRVYGLPTFFEPVLDHHRRLRTLALLGPTHPNDELSRPLPFRARIAGTRIAPDYV